MNNNKLLKKNDEMRHSQHNTVTVMGVVKANLWWFDDYNKMMMEW